MSNIVIKKINDVLNSNLLLEDLYHVPNRGASEQELKEIEKVLPIPLSASYRNLLSLWNGINLDVIRIFGCGNTEDSIPSLNQYNLPNESDLVILASDPSGFLYAQDSYEQIISIDTDGNEKRIIAHNFEDFICNYVFGKDGMKFGGTSWLSELQQHHIIS